MGPNWFSRFRHQILVFWFSPNCLSVLSVTATDFRFYCFFGFPAEGQTGFLVVSISAEGRTVFSISAPGRTGLFWYRPAQELFFWFYRFFWFFFFLIHFLGYMVSLHFHVFAMVFLVFQVFLVFVKKRLCLWFFFLAEQLTTSSN